MSTTGNTVCSCLYPLGIFTDRGNRVLCCQSTELNIMGGGGGAVAVRESYDITKKTLEIFSFVFCTEICVIVQ